jgi:hypothetical protein
MKYPERLCNTYGAKAGLLMYVAQKLPDIPQATMVVKTPEESIDDVLKRADEVPILWPRLFRSSALAELDGYEGEFYTKWMEGFEEGKAKVINPNYRGPYSDKSLFDDDIKFLIRAVEESPKWLKQKDKRHSHLPDKICVIITEESPSTYFSTLVKHPHQDDFYIMTITDAARDFEGHRICISRSTYSFRPAEGALPFKGFDVRGIDDNPHIRKDLETVVAWHDRIANLPEMDNRWTYQLEFGIDPPCLYQVRPFKQKAKANFRIRQLNKNNPSIAIGITPKEGINVRVETDLKNRCCHYGALLGENDMPFAVFDELTNARYIEQFKNYKPENHRANIFYNAHGLLVHEDIKLMRRALVSGLFTFQPKNLKQGEIVNIISDGINMNIAKIGSS